MILVSVFVGAGKALGAAKEMAIAFNYGTAAEVDAFVIALTWVGWIPAVWQGAVTFVTVPLLAGMMRDEAQCFLQELMGLTLLLGVSISLVAAFVFPLLIQIVTPNSSPALMEQTIVALRAMAPMAVPSILSGLLFAFLLARERHVNTLAESLPAISLLVVLLVWPAPSDSGLAPLVFGSLLGFVLMFAALWVLTDRSGTRLALRFSFSSSAWRIFWFGVGMATVNQLFLGLAMPIDQVMVTQLGEGAVATLNYSTRLLALVLSLTATAIGRALLPVLSSISALNPDYAQHVTKRWSAIAFVIGLMIAIVGWPLATPSVRLLFERGAFTSQDTQNVAHVLQYGLLYVPFYLTNVVLTYFLATRKQYGFIAAAAAAMIAVKLIGNYLLIDRMGLPAVQITTLIMYALGSLLYLWRIRLPAKRVCRL